MSTITVNTLQPLEIGKVYEREGRKVKVLDNTELNGQMTTTLELL